MTRNNRKKYSAAIAKEEDYLQFPRWLTTDEELKNLSNDAKVAYVILRDLFRQSRFKAQQGDYTYVDEDGSIYCKLTTKDLEKILSLSDKTVIKIKKALISAGLLEEVRRGQGQINRFYVLKHDDELSDSKRYSVKDALNDNYLQLPRWLIDIEEFKTLSNDAKVAYVILRDRYRQSESTTKSGDLSFVDENNSIYCVHSMKSLIEILNLADKSVTKAKKALVESGLLVEIRKGQGKANRYYVYTYSYNKEAKNDSQTLGGVENRRIYDSKTGEFTSLESENLRPIKKYFINKYSSNNKKIVNKQIEPEDFKACLKNLCNEHYAELCPGRWSKKEWNTLVNSFVEETIREEREIQYPKAYVREAMNSIAYKHDFKNGKIKKNNFPFYNWLES